MKGRISRTGIMIHNVIAEVDMGTPILIREIPFVEGIDEDIMLWNKEFTKWSGKLFQKE